MARRFYGTEVEVTDDLKDAQSPDSSKGDRERSEIVNAKVKVARYDDGLLFDPTSSHQPEGREDRDKLLDKFFQSSAPSNVKRTMARRFYGTEVEVKADLEDAQRPDSSKCDRARSEKANAEVKAANYDDGLLFDPTSTNHPQGQEDRHKLLDKFFETGAPSKVKRSDGIGWIVVRSPSYVNEQLGNLKELQTAWAKLQESTASIRHSDVEKLAKSCGCLGGIWLSFFKTGYQIDNAWKKIAKATVNGELGTHAKVTPYKDDAIGKEIHGDEHAISVYTQDFTSYVDVMRLEHKLRKLGITNILRYKPRVYSQLGVYSGNQWGLRAAIYTSRWDKISKSYKVDKYV